MLEGLKVCRSYFCKEFPGFLRNYDGITGFYDKISLMTGEHILITYEDNTFFALRAATTQGNFIWRSKLGEASCQGDSLENGRPGLDDVFPLQADFPEEINRVTVYLRDNDRNLCRFSIVGLEFFSDSLRQLGSSLPRCRHIADEGERNFAVRTHRDRLG